MKTRHKESTLCHPEMPNFSGEKSENGLKSNENGTSNEAPDDMMGD